MSFYYWPYRYPGGTIKDVGKSLFSYLGNGLDLSPVYGNVDQVGCRGCVIVPDAMMNHLEVPDSLPCACVQGNQALGEEIVPGSVTTEKIISRCFHRQIDEPEFQIGTQLRPCTTITCISPGLFLPGFHTKLTLLGNAVEGPFQFACRNVITPYPGRWPFLVVRSVRGNLLYYQGVAYNNWRRNRSHRWGALPIRHISIGSGNTNRQVDTTTGEVCIYCT